MFWIIIGIFISYVVGSIPTAFIFGRVLKGVDIRNFGSGNVGATNAVRVLGRGAGIMVLSLDILKGLIVVVFLGDLLAPKIIIISDQTFRLLLGLGSIAGHNWTLFLNFKGGKGIATTFGVLIGLSLKISGLSIILSLIILTWFLVFLVVKIVSIASIIAGVSLPLYIVIFKHNLRQPNALVFLSILLSIFVVIRHKANLKRFFDGKEPRFTFRKPSEPK
jgi:glycerol-3-phosphate acyltransferase PlsY